MRKLRRTSQFKKDVKRMGKRGKKFDEFKRVIGNLLAGRKLETKYKGSRECHIEPDWLLIYELPKDALILVRTGSHSDLFR